MEKKQTTIRLPSELKRELEQKAEKMGISFNAIIIMFLQQAIKK